mgnify:CR=1 FL=1
MDLRDLFKKMNDENLKRKANHLDIPKEFERELQKIKTPSPFQTERNDFKNKSNFFFK